MIFEGTTVLVLGLARSGAAAANLLANNGAKVVINDHKEESELDARAIKEASLPGVEIILGEHPRDLFKRWSFDYVVKSPGILPSHPLIQKARELGIAVLSEVEVAYQLTKGQIIGITGTNGKTTTTSLVKEILDLHYPEVYIAGNIGTPLCKVAAEASSEAFIVAELSSFQLDDIVSFRPIIAVILNITPDHLDYHGSMENYKNAKLNILRNQKEKDYSVLNLDDPLVASAAAWAKGILFPFALSGVESKGCGVEKDTIVIRNGSEVFELCSPAELKICGLHNLENALAAAAATYAAGVPPEKIAAGLRQFSAVAHRLEFIATIKGVKFYNDSKATNPVSAEKALQAIKGRKVLIAGGKEKGSDFKGLAKKFPSELSNLVLLGEAADKIAAAAEAAGFSSWEKVESIPMAVERAFQLARPGETVLLSPACASWDMFNSYEERGDLFKKCVNELKERLENEKGSFS